MGCIACTPHVYIYTDSEAVTIDDHYHNQYYTIELFCNISAY